ncbi:tubulin-specific chaperone D [Eupeodes corollae]|uniref:tubulin-specific chaperone D n=1 Tax=Eupeodes corollae TaxID=290404 RepID=UPI00249343F2|nr:tubulin-specific chaperone D [Eupeodes corollae]
MALCEELKDDDRPSNTLELFVELDEVISMIDSIKVCQARTFEKEYEHFTEILSRYQEQPHLLDPHLDVLLTKLLDKIRDPNSEVDLVHACFKYLYILCKVRTYKALVKFLPHELSDLEFALDLLEKQDPKVFENWETRYILLLWMSILVLNPFHMARLDAYAAGGDVVNCTENAASNKTKMERIFDICKTYSEHNDTCAGITAFLSAKYFIRSDIKDIYLEKFFDWVIENNNAETQDVKFGQLAAVAAILKHGKREDLLPYAQRLQVWILGCNYKDSSDFLKYKYYIKIVQRIGLVYLKPRIAAWRYKRGVRSLAVNLAEPSDAAKPINLEDIDSDMEEGEEIVVPDFVEDVIEELLQGLRSPGSDIRWSAAKGIGRVTNRLSRTLADEVIGSVVDILNPLEPHEAWHGACLALAELAKRGLLLPYRLKELVPLLLQALFYDEMKGYMSVGQHIRDAACYMCWAFARAYNPGDLQPFVHQISAGLLTVASFDREINCRRAASAAFQESVGRLGNFPYGIEISTTTDFYTVGLKQNSFLIVSDYIAQYEEYQVPLIDHLVEKKVNHWDTSIRELASKALHKLTLKAPQYMSSEVLPRLFTKTNSIDINMRHGSVLAIGEIVCALKLVENKSEETLLTNQIVSELNELIGAFLTRDQFRGMSGEIMKDCCVEFIRNCSVAKITANSKCLESWQEIIDKCLIGQTRDAATLALAELCKAYYNKHERSDQNGVIVASYLKGAENDLEEKIRMGYLCALGALPSFMVLPQLDKIIDCLVKYSQVPRPNSHETTSEGAEKPSENVITFKWSEARRESIRSLSNIVQTVGFSSGSDGSIANPKYFDKIFHCYMKALEEYSVDNRGDIGAWVREAAMNALYQLLTTCPKTILKPDHVQRVLQGLVQQAVEKIDRTRGLAGRLFCSLINAEPAIPHISQHDRLKEIFPENTEAVLWLFADHTFPMFCSLLELPEYSQKVLLGLSASVGQLTESLIKYSSAALFKFLRSHPNEIPRLCNEIVKNFEENFMVDRVTHPMLNFLDILIGSGTINSVLMDDGSQFADEIFRLVNEEIKGHKKLYKLISSINVFCQLIQVSRLCKKILAKMSVFLGLTHVHVRKTTATKLYEALALHGDSCDIPEENMDEILNLLSETDWGLPLLEIRPVRNELCNLMGIKPPVSGGPTKSTAH